MNSIILTDIPMIASCKIGSIGGELLIICPACRKHLVDWLHWQKTNRCLSLTQKLTNALDSLQIRPLKLNRLSVDAIFQIDNSISPYHSFDHQANNNDYTVNLRNMRWIYRHRIIQHVLWVWPSATTRMPWILKCDYLRIIDHISTPPPFPP